MKRVKIGWLLAGGLLLAACLWFIAPELQYQRAVHKYRKGMKAADIEREYGMHLVLQQTGNILERDATEGEMRHHPAYFARVRCGELVFNDYYEVLGVLRRTPLIILIERVHPEWLAK